MKNRGKLIFAGVLLFAVLCGCSSISFTQKPVIERTEPIIQLPLSQTIIYQIEHAKQSFDYEVTRKQVLKDCYVEYPQLSGMADIAKQERLNKLIEKTIVEPYLDNSELKREQQMIADGEISEDGEEHLIYTQTCTVKLCNDKVLSAVFSKEMGRARWEPTQRFSLNFDLEKERPLSIQSLYTCDEDFSKAVLMQAFLYYCNTWKNGEIDDKEIWENYCLWAYEDSDFYFTPNSLGLLAEYYMIQPVNFEQQEIYYEMLRKWELPAL